MYRVGRHLGRTIYRVGHDGYEELIGIMDTAEDGALVVEALNARERVLAGRGTSEMVPPSQSLLLPIQPCMSCGEERRAPAPERCRQPVGHS